ncbi:Pycsar system effector family protein [Pontixanthobacter rizhaonensis]|nr:Pycsar system effector family protein [Pontixanthobacter rizhaonensis]
MTDEAKINQSADGSTPDKVTAAQAATAQATTIVTSPKAPIYSANAIHMIRTAQLNTLTLSQMADQKASILMGATFLVFSLSISRSLAGDVPPSLLLLAVFSFLSSLCAVMAVLPSVKKADPTHTNTNRLFFGHFATLDEDEWIESVLDDMRADETVFRTMMHDIYQNGQVLAQRKYKFLALAYRIFIGGLLITLVAFGVEALAP